jgi:hypothetical protein
LELGSSLDLGSWILDLGLCFPIPRQFDVPI